MNEATVQATGVARERLIGTDFSNYFTEQDKAREGYQRVFSKGFVRDYALAIRHVTDRITDVLYNARSIRTTRVKCWACSPPPATSPNVSASSSLSRKRTE